MKTEVKEVAMRLEMKEGKTQLVIEETTLFTKAEAMAVSMQIRRWATGLPDHQPGAKKRRKKATSSRQTASRSKPAAKAKAPNGDTASAATAAS
jgi:hypothetical protein